MQQTSTYQSGYNQPYNSQVKYHQGRTEDEFEIVDENAKARQTNGVTTVTTSVLQKAAPGAVTTTVVQGAADPISQGTSAQKYVVPIPPARQMEAMHPQSPHNNALPAIQQERLAMDSKLAGVQQYTQPNTQVQTQTNLLPAHMHGQNAFVHQDAHRMFPESVIPIDRFGFPEGYKHERELTPYVQEDKARLKDRFFHGVGRLTFINSLIVLALSFAVFWIQLAKMLQNNYYESDPHIYDGMVSRRKNTLMVTAVYAEWENDSDWEVAMFMMVWDLTVVFITVLDQLCMYGICAFNLYVIQYSWNKFTLMMNILLFLKDIATIIAWAWEESHYKYWGWTPGISNWGFLFLRRPLALPITFAVLNIFHLRIPFFALGFANDDGDIQSEADLYAEPPEQPGFFMRYIGFPYSRFGKLLVLTYLAALFCLLIVNFFVGLVIVFLGMFGFFTLYFFVFLLTYTLPFMTAKFAIRNRWFAKNYYLLVKARAPHDLIDRELDRALKAHRTFRHRENVYEYPKLLMYFVLFTFCVQYGSVWMRGGSFVALLRFLYASPFQFTFNVLTSKGFGSWYYVMRWLSPL